MRRLHFAFLPLILCFSICVQAATPNEPVYRKVALSCGYPWHEGLTLEFGYDEEQCRARYGNQWRSRCAAAMGRPGETARGIAMKPEAEGYWQWSSPTSVVFVPKSASSLKPDTVYTVSLDKFFHPDFIKINTSSISTRTLPLGAQLLSSQFWVDPSPAATHRVAYSFQFNYPVPENTDMEILRPQDALFGKPEMVWSQNRDSLNLSIPVRRLPEQPSQAGVRFANLGQISLDDGIVRYHGQEKNEDGILFQQNMPGNLDLFNVRSATIQEDTDGNLNRGHVLRIETSLYARPSDVQKNLLLLELPEYNSKEASSPYDWSAAPAIPAEIYKKGRPLHLDSLHTDDEPVAKFLFRINPTPGRYILAGLPKNTPSATGHKLVHPWFAIMQGGPEASRLGFLQPGNILPLADSGLLDIYSTDLDEIIWEVQLVENAFLALLAACTGDAFTSPNTGFGMDALSRRIEGRLSLADHGPGKAQFSTIDLANALKKIPGRDKNPSGLAQINLVGHRKGKTVASVSRLILATNLGLVIKQSAQGKTDCFAQLLDSRMPAAGAKISILGANGQPVVSTSADSLGHVAFPSLSGLKRESRPVAAIAELNGNLAWLPLADRSRELNYSEFPTGGIHTSRDGINALVFDERGIYRPGDVLNFGCIARRGDFSPLPPNLPLFAEILDPRGIKIWEQPFRANEYGLSALEWVSPATALSGTYTMNVRPAANGDIIGSTLVRIEEFEPDSLKLKISPPVSLGWLHMADKQPGNRQVIVDLQNLYGTPAAGHRIKPVLEISAPVFSFPGFEDYIFTDISAAHVNTVRHELPECITDSSGRAVFHLPAELVATNSARIKIMAEGFDAAGSRATVGTAVILTSPREKMLGYRPAGALTNMRFIAAGEKAELDIMALNPELVPQEWPDVRFSISAYHYATSLVQDGNGGFRYDETPVLQPVKSWTGNVANQGSRVVLDTSRPGEFILQARDGEGRLLASIPYAVAGKYPLPPNSPLAAGKMRLRLDRDAYAAGDVINVAMSLPYAGTGLLSIERDGVEAFCWFTAEAGDSVQRIAIPAGFEGKGYVVASFARSNGSDNIYMSPHTYAVAPFTANIRQRDIGLRLDAPNVVKPGEELEISLHTKAPALAIVAVVDEGILQLTGFSTPDPLKTLLGDRALDVMTLQAYDLLMPLHGSIGKRLAAYGGGTERSLFGARFENPFKRKHEPPVAFWSGIVQTNSAGARILVPVPDYYNGSLRIMCVGVSEHGAGSTSRIAKMRADLVATPSLPAAVSPGDVFDGNLILANTTEKNIPVKLGMRIPEALKISRILPETAMIPARGEVLVPFTLKALDKPMAAEIEFDISYGETGLKRKAYISVRPPTTYLTTLSSGVATTSGTLPQTRELYACNAKSIASISTVPIPLAAALNQYLSTYPYGCTEQLVSRAFAQILLRAWPVARVDKEGRQKVISAAIGAIRERSTGNGISLWPGGNADLLLTAYATDFLLTMREAGFAANDDLLESLCRILAENCALNESSLEAARTSAYAIWVLTRSGRITTQLLENLVQTMDARVLEWRTDIAGVLAAASEREMHVHNSDISDKIIYSASGWFDEYAQYALHMAILCRYFPEKCVSEVKKDFYEATGIKMLGGDYATFSANQGIRAIMAMAGSGIPEILQATLACADKEEGQGSLLANGSLYNYETATCSRYELRMPENSGPVFWQIATSGYDRNAPHESVANGLEIERAYLDASGKIVESARLGEEITVELRVRAMRDSIPDCVIVDLLPGGFEMVVPRGRSTTDGMPPGVKFMDRKEDRMLIFADLTNRQQTFSYHIRPVASGSFITSPPSVQCMYNQGLYGHGSGGSIEIAK